MNAKERVTLLSIFLSLVLQTAACGSDGTSGTAAGTPGRDVRYCELLFVFLEDEGPRAQVWGTQGLNTCPAELWEGVDVEDARAEMDALLVVVNAPRYWTLDRTSGSTMPEGEPRFFDGLEMQPLATLPVDLSSSNEVYVEHVVERYVTMHFDAGKRVYELTAPSGAVYTMQSYSQIVEPELDVSDLLELEARLQLPEGWSYSTRVLDADLAIETAGDAVVLQDDLRNSYSRRTTGL